MSRGSSSHKRGKCCVLWVLLCALGILLGGCGLSVDEELLNKSADYSIDIALPYATVTPAPMEQEQAGALVIDSEGGVTLNDPASILQGEAQSSTSDGSNYNSLRLGNTGLAVQALQTRLRELGYYSSDISGVFDDNTETAVRRFEQTYGTMQTGVATADLQRRLFASDALVYGSEEYNNAVIAQYRVLQRGDVGSSVYALQQRLRNLNYPITELSGTYDNETANAVMLFYEAYGLTASDVASVALQRELYSDNARVYGSESTTSASESLNILSDDNVLAIQQRLIELGYLTGEATGQQDTQTQLAVKLFEEACGQLPSGALNQNILALLQSDSAPGIETLAGRYSNLLEGSSGDAVLRVQQRLVELGFAAGVPTGSYGSATSESLRLFQQANGLEPTGVASSYVQAVLFSSFALNIDGETVAASTPRPIIEPTTEPEAPTVTRAPGAFLELSLGSSGDSVLRLQQRLSELGYVSSAAGSFDELTQRAVSSFQAAIGREPNGVASSDLQLFLYSDAAPLSGTSFYDSVQPYRKLALHDSGDDVTLLQRKLYDLGYLARAGVENSIGTYNEATQQAVASFQSAIGYENIDGVASAELQCYLHSRYSQPKA